MILVEHISILIVGERMFMMFSFQLLIKLELSMIDGSIQCTPFLS